MTKLDWERPKYFGERKPDLIDDDNTSQPNLRSKPLTPTKSSKKYSSSTPIRVKVNGKHRLLRTDANRADSLTKAKKSGNTPTTTLQKYGELLSTEFGVPVNIYYVSNKLLGVTCNHALAEKISAFFSAKGIKITRTNLRVKNTRIIFEIPDETLNLGTDASNEKIRRLLQDAIGVRLFVSSMKEQGVFKIIIGDDNLCNKIEKFLKRNDCQYKIKKVGVNIIVFRWIRDV